MGLGSGPYVPALIPALGSVLEAGYAGNRNPTATAGRTPDLPSRRRVEVDTRSGCELGGPLGDPFVRQAVAPKAPEFADNMRSRGWYDELLAHQSP